MLMVSWLTWWYGRGWWSAVLAVQRALVGVAQAFSVSILLRTLFAPWKRIITFPGASLEAKLRALGDNIFSRAVGFTVRALVLLSAGIVEVLAGALGIVWIILWPLLPVAAVGLIVKGITG